MRNHMGAFIISAVFLLVSACSGSGSDSAPDGLSESSPDSLTSDYALPPEGTMADAVFTNGQVLTGRPDQQWAEAVATTNGEIIYVGDAVSAATLADQNTKQIDLGGKLVLPEFFSTNEDIISEDRAESFIEAVRQAAAQTQAQ